MSREISGGSNKVYYQVVDGSFRTRVPATHPEAVERINKNNKQVFEREVDSLVGMVENIAFEDSEFGLRIAITLDANSEGKNPVINFGVESRDGRDVLRKLPSADLSKEVRFAPYKFTPDGSDQTLSGLSISQENTEGEFTKVENHFFDVEKKEYRNGFPTIDWDNATEAQKKIYKITRDEFLVEYAKKHVLPSVGVLVGTATYALKEDAPVVRNGYEYPKEELPNDSDLPF